jgi:hypothetical protein
MAALDAEIEGGIRARDARRRHAAREIVRRMSARGGPNGDLPENAAAAAANVLSALTGFETYDALAMAGHSQDEIIALITALARFAVTTLPESGRFLPPMKAEIQRGRSSVPTA